MFVLIQHTTGVPRVKENTWEIRGKAKCPGKSCAVLEHHLNSPKLHNTVYYYKQILICSF